MDSGKLYWVLKKSADKASTELIPGETLITTTPKKSEMNLVESILLSHKNHKLQPQRKISALAPAHSIYLRCESFQAPRPDTLSKPRFNFSTSFNPTDKFTNLKPRSPSIHGLYVVEKQRSTWIVKGSVGWELQTSPTPDFSYSFFPSNLQTEGGGTIFLTAINFFVSSMPGWLACLFSSSQSLSLSLRTLSFSFIPSTLFFLFFFLYFSLHIFPLLFFLSSPLVCSPGFCFHSFPPLEFSLVPLLFV